MNSDPNIGDLLRQLRDDTGTLVKEEVALAKTELSEKLSETARNAGKLLIGGLIAYTGFILLLVAVCHLLTSLFLSLELSGGMSAFLGFLSVGIVLAVVGAALTLNAMTTLTGQNFTPTRTARSLQEDKQWAQSRMP